MKNLIKISDEALYINECLALIESPSTGGLNFFVGTVRNKTQNRSVKQLLFECYKPMAIKELQKISTEARQQFKIQNIVIHHRVGLLEVGDIAVIIGVSAAHRDAAFQACRYAIDTLKETVPIWKKEIFTDGEVWVSAHP
ncbi:MAG: molybdenum cofactor biosynthesis protein MoaE [Flavobacteriales bacterium]|nr:molybdenum cofactor biosynthesis protein MoaE [Flavobacteriales bacterium]